MICIIIKGPSFKEAYQQITKALEYADLIELRLDHFHKIDYTALKSLKSTFSIPMIFTLRSAQQGGYYTGSEEQRLAEIRSLIELKPEYLDLESNLSPSFIEEIIRQYPDIKLILSYHNFAKTPEDLESIYEEMQKRPAFFYKIAVKANRSVDALRLLSWMKKSDKKIITISMGELGQISRIIGPTIGSPITYACLEEDQNNSLAQLTAKALLELYQYRTLNQETTFYGLIGEPVNKSLSHKTHNHLIKTYGLKAIYIKLPMTAIELPQFLQLAKTLPFRGLSITMPLKESILPYLDYIHPQADDIGAVNTLLFENGMVIGSNTDGIGALNAIERTLCVKGKQAIILGAGGAAKAIAYEARRRGAFVTILNRDGERAHQAANRFNCVGKGLDHMSACCERGYDILINCTSHPMPIDSVHILPQALVMDITINPLETSFLKHAQEKGCRIIYGYQMFVEQAVGQFDIWFKNLVNPADNRKILEQQAYSFLTHLMHRN